jgi:SAM-dependent methyltransferase
MTCNICNNKKYIVILNKGKIPIWTGSPKKKYHYKCQLRQCVKCGHVYQEVSSDLSTILKNIYKSNNAQVSTSLGIGNWGLERAKIYLSRINYKKYKSAIELGCANGFILKFLEDFGYDTLIGIEPSLSISNQIGKIKFIKSFANEKTSLGLKVDLIFSNCVFEHIEDINGILEFVRKHLNVNGEFFFTVPNAQRELEDGDSSLFMHEHINYFTKNVINFVLVKNRFQVNYIKEDSSALYVSAKLIDKNYIKLKHPKLYNNFSESMNNKINKFENLITSKKKIILHGVCNKLNNIFGWSKKKISFTLVDNDEIKVGKIFFGQKVLSLNDVNLSKYDNVFIVPNSYFKDIKKQYIDLGFKGKFYDV